MTENCIMVKILFSKDTIPHGLKSYLNSTRYVAFDKLKLNEIVNVSDLEIGSVQDIEVVYRKAAFAICIHHKPQNAGKKDLPCLPNNFLLLLPGLRPNLFCFWSVTNLPYRQAQPRL